LPGNASTVTPGPTAGTAPGSGTAEAADDDVTLTDAKAMRALAHPLRMAILQLLSVRETLTATQASEALGESPANCAFHLRTLAKYGFVREAGGGRGRERPWTLANRSWTLTTNQPDPQTALAADELSRFWLERWIDRARRVYGSRNELPGWDEATGWTSTHVFLTAEETSKLRGDARRLLKHYEDRLADPALRPEGALPVEWTVFASPAPELAEPDPGPGGQGDGRPDAPAGPDARDSQQRDIS
jgi:DNA-binding transcriptional ArsR family regulator